MNLLLKFLLFIVFMILLFPLWIPAILLFTFMFIIGCIEIQFYCAKESELCNSCIDKSGNLFDILCGCFEEKKEKLIDSDNIYDTDDTGFDGIGHLFGLFCCFPFYGSYRLIKRIERIERNDILII